MQRFTRIAHEKSDIPSRVSMVTVIAIKSEPPSIIDWGWMTQPEASKGL